MTTISNMDTSTPLHKTLNIIGCGQLGRTLAHLWARHSAFAIQDVLNRSLDSGKHAVAFIGSGQAVERYTDVRPAGVYMIAASDDQIPACCDGLAKAGKLSDNTVVFHCSGILPSTELRAAIRHGAAVASVHPIRSFAAPDQVIHRFEGTYCGVEGDPRALAVLSPALSAIGAQIVPIHADSKIIYHSAAVFACNYLTTLLDVAMHAYEKSGIPQDVGLKLMEPLVRGTVDNVFRLGPAQALTGPIARGDMPAAERQAQAVAAWDQEYGTLYETFMELTRRVAARRDTGKP